MMLRCISETPTYISVILASRYSRSMGKVFRFINYVHGYSLNNNPAAKKLKAKTNGLTVNKAEA